jgi:H+/Cl- antiporter ClcA
MSGDHSMLVALMATALIANSCAGLINKEGVYHTLAKRFLPVKTPEPHQN